MMNSNSKSGSKKDIQEPPSEDESPPPPPPPAPIPVPVPEMLPKSRVRSCSANEGSKPATNLWRGPFQGASRAMSQGNEIFMNTIIIEGTKWT